MILPLRGRFCSTYFRIIIIITITIIIIITIIITTTTIIIIIILFQWNALHSLVLAGIKKLWLYM